MRIDEIKKHIDLASQNENQDALFKNLKVYFKELYPMMNKEDQKKHLDKFKFLDDKHIRRSLAIKKRKKNVPNNRMYYDEWDLELRNLEQKYGMNMPKKADARWALAGR